MKPGNCIHFGKNHSPRMTARSLTAFLATLFLLLASGFPLPEPCAAQEIASPGPETSLLAEEASPDVLETESPDTLTTLPSSLAPLTEPALSPDEISPVSPRPGFCAVWVNADGGELRSREKCRELVRRLREIHADDVFVVVRSMGDALYRSELAPFPANWVNADLDPLAEILDEAHRAGEKPVRVHAVLNLLPLYSSHLTFSPPPGHLMNRRPEWLTKHQAGNDRDAAGVAWLDPAIPEVQRHLQGVVRELLTRYAVDGAHFAGLRYPGTDLRWGYNPLALENFRLETGIADASPAPDDPEWVRWRANRLSNLAQLLSETARRARPGIPVSVSALATGDPPGPEMKALDFQNALQFWPGWCENDLFDIALLDNRVVAETDEAGFIRWIDYANARKGSAKLLVQVLGEGNTEAGVRRLLRVALARGCDGVLLRSYQVPARDLANGSVFLDFLGRTLFSPDYQIPAYVRNAMLAALPPIQVFADPPMVRELPRPVPVAPPPRIAPRPLTEADITHALLGAVPSDEAQQPREEPPAAPEFFDIGLLPDEAIPPPPAPVGMAIRVRVQLRNGRSFLADQVGEGPEALTVRPLGQSAVVSIPLDLIARVSALEEEK